MDPGKCFVETEMRKILILLVLYLTGCVGIPENVKPVDHFRLEKYLGEWYEIALPCAILYIIRIDGMIDP